MKANRKFVNGEEAVSAVIGVILMVAITVAIAATVYVWVTGFGGGGTMAPSMNIDQDASASTGYTNFTVTSASASAKWGDLNISIGGDTLNYSKVRIISKTGKWYTPSNVSTLSVSAGDKISIQQDLSGDTLYITHTPSNSIIVKKPIY